MNNVSDSLEQFCIRHGLSAPIAMTRLKGGRNSEVFRVASAQGQWILKNYFRHALDSRDRLGTEYRFLQLMRSANIDNVAVPVGMDEESGRAIYSFLPGERLQAIKSDNIGQAVDFVVQINRAVADMPADVLQPAADACFSWRDHVALAEKRIARLLAIRAETDLEKQVRALVDEYFVPLLEQRKAKAIEAVPAARFTQPLDRSGMIVSPSDFGFHNALSEAGRLCFVDFEYAGWDDPAKLICDFICQPELPVSDEQGRQFLTMLTARLPDTEAIRHRVEVLLPLHRLKWCCILLNEFCAEDRMRRVHAGSGSADMLAVQLEKARSYFFKHLGE